MSQLWLLLFSIPAIIIATTAHEYTRALVSTLLGDTIPKKQKRLTLNPVNHFEPIGFIFLMSYMFSGTGIGWGKPVQTNSMNYKNRKMGVLLTAALPSVVNIVLAIIFKLLFGLTYTLHNVYLTIFLQCCFTFNILMFVCNLIPVAPFDMEKVLGVLLPPNKYFAMVQYQKVIQLIFLLLFFLGIVGVVLRPVTEFILSIFSNISI